MLAALNVEDELWMDLEKDSRNQLERWEPKLHKRQGVLRWEPHRLARFWTLPQLRGESALPGTHLFNEAKNMRILNGNGVDFLLRHQYLIPIEYRNSTLFGWWTIYYERTAGREPFVRGLWWDSAQYQWEEIDMPVLGNGFTANCVGLLYIHPSVKAHGNDAKL